MQIREELGTVQPREPQKQPNISARELQDEADLTHWPRKYVPQGFGAIFTR